MKKCTKCSSEYPSTNEYFNKDASKKDLLHSHCRVCTKKSKSKYYSLNKERLIKQSVDYQRNDSKSKERKKKYAQSERGKEFSKEYRIKNREALNKKAKDRIHNNPISAQLKKEAQRRYVEKNRQEINRKERIRVKIRNKEKEILYKKKTYEKYKNDPYWKLVHYSRIRMNSIISKETKQFKIKDMVLYSKEEFISHIESLFDKKMNWGNHGKKGWHIDHIKPISSFDLNNIEECIECWSLKNLQPLWWSDNLSKGSKLNFNT
jgi:hypothetical protein